MADNNDNTPDGTAETSGENASTLDKVTNTTPEKRADFIAKAQETLSEAVSTAIDAVKANPKTTAAIAAGATAAVAGAAYGATKLAKTKAPAKPRAAAKRAPAKRAPAPNK